MECYHVLSGVMLLPTISCSFLPASHPCPALAPAPRLAMPCRDAEVLSMFAMIINRLREKMEAEVPRVFSAVFECTLQMITRNFEVGAGAAAASVC